MVIVLVSKPKNIGILTLTDHIILKISKNNLFVTGWNYLNKKNDFDKIKEESQTKNVIVKYISSNTIFTESSYLEFQEIADIIFKIPTYQEEIMPVVPLKFFKGEKHDFSKHIKEFYK